MTGVRGAVDLTVWREVGAPLVGATGAGPLSGHTVAVKDLFAVAGFAVGAGVDDFRAERAPETGHAAVVAALLGAGADIVGIARTDEFAYSITGGNGHHGMPVNPAAPQRIPGGSSSGPAVAVARGEASIGLGTDTAGSIRVPGAYQGLWGIRTTHAALDPTGLLPLAPSFDTIGWLTRDPETLAAVAAALLPEPPNSSLARLDTSAEGVSSARAGVSVCEGVPARGASSVDSEVPVGDSASAHAAGSARAGALSGDGTAARPGGGVDPFAGLVVDAELCAAAEPETARRCLRAAREVGAEEVEVGVELDRWCAAFRVVQAYEAWAGHGEWISAHPGALAAEVGGRFAWAATVTAAEAAVARGVVREAAGRIRAAVGDRVLVLPSTAGPPPFRDADPAAHEAARAATLRLTCLASIAGLPAVTLPLPGTGLPIGLCLLGAPHTDRALIRLAARCAAALSATAR